MKQYRCIECTLMRCDTPNSVCEECQSNAPQIVTMKVGGWWAPKGESELDKIEAALRAGVKSP
jgi:hypothetical protein